MDKIKIVVVDDDIMNLKIAELILKSKFDVCCVQSGEGLFEYLNKEIPQMILLDVHMPNMSGFDVIRKLKDNKETCNIPVIFLTGDNDKEVENRCFEEGAVDYITKPFVADVVLQRINRVLQNNTII